MNLKIGTNCIISKDAKIGKNVTIGNNCILSGKVTIGDNTELKNFVELRDGTVVGNNCLLDSRVSSSGNCVIGNNVTLRYDTIIARGCEIEDNCYFSPRVMTNNLDSEKTQIGGAKFGKNTFIGTNAVIHHGLKIGNNVKIGAMSFVNTDCEDNSVYFGIPANKK